MWQKIRKKQKQSPLIIQCNKLKHLTCGLFKQPPSNYEFIVKQFWFIQRYFEPWLCNVLTNYTILATFLNNFSFFSFPSSHLNANSVSRCFQTSIQPVLCDSFLLSVPRWTAPRFYLQGGLSQHKALQRQPIGCCVLRTGSFQLHTKRVSHIPSGVPLVWALCQCTCCYAFLSPVQLE